jgi:hypothetical protein
MAARTEYLLTSEDFIKSCTNLSDNLSGKYLQGAIREAQEVALRDVLGSCLLDTIKAKFAASTLSGWYKDLVDRCQYFLAYTAIADVCMKATYKVTNFGLAKSTDENLTVATMDEIVANQGYYQAKADGECLRLQQWLLDNRAEFPELGACACQRIQANLTSAATCGIWLGGARGTSNGPIKPYRK